MTDRTKPTAAFVLGPTIEVRIEEVEQLFDTLDPFPFQQKDLDKDAEDYIVNWARELPRRDAIKILVHLPAAEAETEPARELGGSIRRFFAYRAERVRFDLKELFRVGRRSIAIGICALAVCLLLGHAISGRLGGGYVARFIEESLVIVGWVANWRPIEIFLYDWLPILRRLRVYERLSRAEVSLKPD